MWDETKNPDCAPRSRKKIVLAMAAFFLGLVLISLVFAHFNLDRRISGVFHHPQEGFFLEDHAPWIWLYRFGTIPGLVFIALSIFAFFMSTLSPRWADIRRPAAIVVLTALLGSGIMANVVLKPYWGRPRPSQTTDFGGEWAYRDALSPGTPGKGQSFPSGHCTIAFLFVSAWAARKKYPRAAFAITVFGLTYGLFMSAARIVQGAHFATDAMWALGVIVLSAGFWDVVLPDPLFGREQAAGRIRPVPAIIALAALLVLGFDFAAHRPFFEHHRRYVYLEPGTKKIVIRTNVPLTKEQVIRDAQGLPRILLDSQGFGFFSARRELTDRREVRGDTLIHNYEIRATGWFSELNHSARVILPPSVPAGLSVAFETPEAAR